MSSNTNNCMTKYFKIVNVDRSPFTYGCDITDPETLKMLENSFVDSILLAKYAKPEHLIADVEVKEQHIKTNMFDKIDGRILYADEINLANFRVPDEHEFANPLQEKSLTIGENESKDPTEELKKLSITDPNHTEQFEAILSAFNSRHRAFFVVSIKNRLCIKFNPEIYLGNEIVELQIQLSKCLKKNDGSCDAIAAEYNDKSINNINNIQAAHLRFIKLLKQFNESTLFISKLLLNSNGIIEWSKSFDNDEEYQLYLHTLAFFAASVIDNPLFM